MNEFSLTMLFPDWHYLLTGPFSSPKGITALFCLILGGLFIYELFIFMRNVFQVRHNIRFISGTLSRVQDDEWLEHRAHVREEMNAQVDCGSLWAGFDESMAVHQCASGRKLFSTVDASYFFSTHTLAREITENRHIVAIPSYLTAIGVLGTFAGLTLGLAGLGNIDGGNTELLKISIAGMIHAASIAFTTSFWGVLLSVVFNALEKIMDGRIRSDISHLQRQVNRLFPRLSVEVLLMDIVGHAKSSEATMLGLAQKIGDRLQEAMHSIHDESSARISETLQEALAPAITKLAKTADRMVNRQAVSSEKALEHLVDNFMDKFGEAGASQGDMLRTSSVQLQSLLSDMRGEYEHSRAQADALDEKRHGILQDTVQQLANQFENYQSVGEHHTQAAQGVVAKTEDLTSSVAEISQNLLEFTGMIGEITTQLHHSAVEIKGGNTELARTSRELAKSSEVMSGAITDAAQTNAAVSQTNMLTAQQFHALLEQVDASCASAEEVSQQIRASADAGRDIFVALEGHQKGYQHALNQHVQELEKKLSGLLAQHLDVVQEKTHDRMQAWDKETIRYTTAMQGVVNVMQELVDDIESPRP